MILGAYFFVRKTFLLQCNKIFDSGDWRRGLCARHGDDNGQCDRAGFALPGQLQRPLGLRKQFSLILAMEGIDGSADTGR